MFRIIVASDSFKGCLSSAEVAEAVKLGIHDALEDDCCIISLDMADGGEGTLSALSKNTPCSIVKAKVHDPLGRVITASYGIINDITAIIETAQASGLTLLSDTERNPLYTSSNGTGELISDALQRGCRKFLIGLGGSATNDGGTGMLEALGFRFIDKNGNTVDRCCGARLIEIADIDSSDISTNLKNASFTVACDVSTPFCGPEGATKVFSAQKGADDKSETELEKGMVSFSECIKDSLGIDLAHTPGSGAAGGLGGAFHAFLNGRLVKGTDLILDAIGFDEIICDADLVITGEGKIDDQTSKGKVPSGILTRCQHQNIPVIAIGGLVTISSVDILLSGFEAILPIQPVPESPEEFHEAMKPENAARNIRATIHDYLIGQDIRGSIFKRQSLYNQKNNWRR